MGQSRHPGAASKSCVDCNSAFPRTLAPGTRAVPPARARASHFQPSRTLFPQPAKDRSGAEKGVSQRPFSFGLAFSADPESHEIGSAHVPPCTVVGRSNVRSGGFACPACCFSVHSVAVANPVDAFTLLKRSASFPPPEVICSILQKRECDSVEVGQPKRQRHSVLAKGTECNNNSKGRLDQMPTPHSPTNSGWRDAFMMVRRKRICFGPSAPTR